MPGFSADHNGTSQQIMYADNVDFSGADNNTVQERVIADGQLLIGASTSPKIRVNTLTAGSGITVTNGAGTITIASFAPNSIVQIFDDFVGSGVTALTSGQQSWKTSSGWTQDTSISDKDHPGVFGSPINTAGSQHMFLGLPSGGAILKQYFLGGGVLNVNFVINFATLSTPTNTYTFRIGIGDTENADQANGCYLEYTHNVNSGNWVYKTAANSVRTAVNSSVAVSTGWHNVGLTVNANGTSVSFTVNGVSLGAPIITNLPILGTTAFLDIVRSAGTIPALAIRFDLFYLQQILTNAR